MFGIDFGSETTVSASPFTPPGTGIPLVESSEKPHIMSPSHSHPPTSHYEDISSHTQVCHVIEILKYLIIMIFFSLNPVPRH